MDSYGRIVSLWQAYNIRSATDLDKYLDNFRILFAYNSGKIENAEITYHDTREIFEKGRVTGYTGSTRALFEQQNQKLCYELLKEKIVTKDPLTVALVKEVHLVLTSGTYDERRFIANRERPGEFKKHDYVTGVWEVGADATEVEAELTELLEELNAFEGPDPLKAATYFHACFEYIHPFADGNGRTGRSLLNYFLLTHDYPPLIIYDKDKSGYYAALEIYDRDEEIAPLYDFLKDQTVKTWEKTLERHDRP